MPQSQSFAADEIVALRADTPGCLHRTHLNNAGAGLMPAPVISTIKDYIDLEATIGGYEAEAASQDVRTKAYESVAGLLATNARNIAFTENATVSFAQALSAITFQKDDVILTTRNDYASNQIQFLSLKSRFGVDVIRAPDLPTGGVDPDGMFELIQKHNPKIVCVTHIPTNSGLVQDVATIGAMCKKANVTYLVDACQSVGQMPLDVDEIGCDFLSATARKFLRGPRGSGFLFVSDKALNQGLAPLFPDMAGADWSGADSYKLRDSARRFENWEFSYALLHATGAAAQYATAIGLDRIHDRVNALATKTRERVAAIPGVRVLDRGAVLSGIVSLALANTDPAHVVAKLRSQNINLSSQVRSSAVIDFDDKGVSDALRISPHYYNTEEEIETAAAALEAVLSE